MMADEAKADRGASGPAFSSRPSQMHNVEGRSRGTAVRGEAVEVRRYLDAELWDRMWRAGQISDAQHRAAEKYARLFVAAGLHPRLSANYGERALGRALRDDGDGEEPSALDRYRSATRRCPPMYAERVEALVLGAHPGIRWLATLQAGLDWYAKVWGLERDQADDLDEE